MNFDVCTKQMVSQEKGWSAFSLKRLFIERPFHRMSIGVPFHQIIIKCPHSPNMYPHISHIFYEKAPSAFSLNAL